MSHTDLTPQIGVPTSFYQGDTLDFSMSDGRYTAADDWVLTVYLSGESNLNAVGSPAEGSGSWTVNFPAAKTALLKPGVYEWQAIVVSGSEQRSINAGRSRVKASVATAAAGSLVTHAQKTLTAIEAAIEYRLTGEGGIDEINISGQSIKHMDIAQLRALRGQYTREVHAEQFGRSSMRNNIQVAFLRP